MSANLVQIRELGAHAALLEINNPPANALGRAARAEILSQLDRLDADHNLRALVLTGSGRAFCSGDDLKEQEAAQKDGSAARIGQLGEFGKVLARIESFRVPVIAAINGFCIGGGLELALCCDIRIASTEASFTCAAVNIGLIASAWRLPRLIGEGAAKHMLLTGSPFDAAAAEKFGLVSAVHDPHELLNAATALAERIASRAPLSVEATKRVASRAIDLNPQEGARMMSEEVGRLVTSADHAEALAAFREKRAPKFTRR
ncbi:MAG TPA: enoyl-CoA hydratase-related protein [Rhizomicrobium sp.]|nr:enoyl-CoA hydratase-related protein [Rhizomicrobium sp.]